MQSPANGGQCPDMARLESGYRKLAALVAAGEHWAVPLFMRLEAELENARAQRSAIDRAVQAAKAGQGDVFFTP